jgi:hypothetical protein
MFPVGMGDEDAASVLTKNPRRPSRSGLAAASTLTDRIEVVKSPTSDRAAKNIRDSTEAGQAKSSSTSRPRGSHLSREDSEGSAHEMKTKGKKYRKASTSSQNPSEEVTSEPVPLHSSFRRSKEFLEADRIEERLSNKRLALSLLEEQKSKRMAKMSEAFRRRQEERRLRAQEEGTGGDGDEGMGGGPHSGASSR